MITTKYVLQGSDIFVISLDEKTALDVLPPNVYTVQHDPMRGFYLRTGNAQLQVPKRIYGNALERVDKCIKTYIDRTTSTGILLTGDKGTGKTLLMSLIANEVINRLNLPVILIKEPYTGQPFVSFIESLGECCLMFDEFGKMYTSSNHEDKPNQDALLSLLDGVDKVKRMVIMSENSESSINEYMLNRPSRLYYHFKYFKLDEASIQDYCDDFKLPKEEIATIVDISRRSWVFSFDMLQTIVEEYNRFNQPIDQIVTDLNIDVKASIDVEIEIVKVVEKNGNVQREIHSSPVVTKPSHSNRYTYIRIKPTKDEVDGIDEDDYTLVDFKLTDLVYQSAGMLVYENAGFTIVAKELPIKTVDYYKYF